MNGPSQQDFISSKAMQGHPGGGDLPQAPLRMVPRPTTFLYLTLLSFSRLVLFFVTGAPWILWAALMQWINGFLPLKEDISHDIRTLHAPFLVCQVNCVDCVTFISKHYCMNMCKAQEANYAMYYVCFLIFTFNTELLNNACNVICMKHKIKWVD